MLIPHLHFNGSCLEAMKLYEKALNAKSTVSYMDSNLNTVVHAEMVIKDTRIMMNDAIGLNSCTGQSPIHMIVTFQDKKHLIEAYEHMKDSCKIIQPLQRTDYSACIVDFVDRYGIRWGFMVE